MRAPLFKLRFTQLCVNTEVWYDVQVVWAETTKVGCGAATYRDGKWFATLYTCNYGPNGNFIRGEMYRAGPACSACPPGTQCSQQFPGLCGPYQAKLVLRTISIRISYLASSLNVHCYPDLADCAAVRAVWRMSPLAVH